MASVRTVFFISDRTGITAEMLGHSVLTQFSPIEFRQIALPFVDSIEKATQVKEKIDAASKEGAGLPIVFSTLVEPEVRAVIADSKALFLDCFQTFIVPIEAELGVQASRLVGLTHGVTNPLEYHRRIDSINYTMAHDDGLATQDLHMADVILVGVSRCGKTPTCLYMALQFGIKAANYPFTPEDLESPDLPSVLRPHSDKLFGLTIDADRLHQIRTERRPGSKYASISTCEWEVKAAERLMLAIGLNFLDTTTKSIEEIATTIFQESKLVRHIY